MHLLPGALSKGSRRGLSFDQLRKRSRYHDPRVRTKARRGPAPPLNFDERFIQGSSKIAAPLTSRLGTSLATGSSENSSLSVAMAEDDEVVGGGA